MKANPNKKRKEDITEYGANSLWVPTKRVNL